MIYLDTHWFRSYRSALEQRSLRLVTAPTAEPISLDEARSHLRLDLYGSPLAHPDDAMLEDVYIPAARGICEMVSGRALAPAVFEVGVGGFDGQVRLGIGPVRGVTSVEYFDGTAYVTMAESDYIVDQYTDGGYVSPAYNTSWPFAAVRPNGVRVRFSAGYDLDGASPTGEFPMPPHYKYALLLALGHVYENRENTTSLNLAEIPMGIQAILGPSSLVNGFA